MKHFRTEIILTHWIVSLVQLAPDTINWKKNS